MENVDAVIEAIIKTFRRRWVLGLGNIHFNAYESYQASLREGLRKSVYLNEVIKKAPNQVFTIRIGIKNITDKVNVELRITVNGQERVINER